MIRLLDAGICILDAPARNHLGCVWSACDHNDSGPSGVSAATERCDPFRVHVADRLSRPLATSAVIFMASYFCALADSDTAMTSSPNVASSEGRASNGSSVLAGGLAAL